MMGINDKGFIDGKEVTIKSLFMSDEGVLLCTAQLLNSRYLVEELSKVKSKVYETINLNLWITKEEGGKFIVATEQPQGQPLSNILQVTAQAKKEINLG